MSSPGSDGTWPRATDDEPQAGVRGQVPADDTARRRASSGRAPGAHRAAKPEGRLPALAGLRKPKPREEVAGRPARDPIPAELPLSGNVIRPAGGSYGYDQAVPDDYADGFAEDYATARLRATGPADQADFYGSSGYIDPADPLGLGRTPEQDGYPQVAGPSQPGGPSDPGGPGDPPDPKEPSAAQPSLVRSSGVMALGTLASRMSGLVRSVVVLYALGAVQLANAYNYSNSLPNTVYNLAIGGILTSVIVPLLVTAGKRDNDLGERYTQRMFTLVTVILAVVTIAATAASGPIATLYGCAKKTCAGTTVASADYRHVLIIFAYFFIPQIFFYGISSLAGAILNARGHFAAPMWTPVLNNIVVIAVTVMFVAIAGFHQTVQTITPFEVDLIGVGTTLGIIVQTVALIPALRRVGFRWRPRFDFKRVDVTEIGRMAGWMFGYVLTTQVAYLVTAKVAASVNNPALTGGVGKGFTAYTNAWLLFQLPYAIVGISVITALLPRMSAHASERRYDLVQADFSTGVRLGSVIVAPAALVLAVIGPALAEVLLGWGNTTIADARYLGLVFSIFSLGLVPYMLFQLLLRVFYSLHDSRTPALIGLATMITNIATNLIAFAVVSPGNLVAALGIGFGLANSVGVVLAWMVLRERLGGLAGRQIGRSLIRMHVAALPAALFALVVTLGISAEFSTAKVWAAITVIVGIGGALVLYVAFARLLRVTEVTDLTSMVRSRLLRR